MIRPARLGAAATIAALGVSLATPALDSASAATSPLALPASSELTTALTTLGVPSAQVSSLVAEITALESSGVTNTSSLTGLDTTLGNLLGTITSLLSTLLDSPGQALESSIASVQSLLPASASSADTGAVSELTAALTGAGLGSLLSGFTGSAGAESQLVTLPALVPGASIPAGDLGGVGAIVSQLATEAGSGTDGSTLTAVANLLDSGSALTPAQLETAITGLSGITSGDPSGTIGVTVAQVSAALASELGQSGTVLGTIPGLSPADAMTVLSELNQLGLLGAGSQSTSLPGLGALLVNLGTQAPIAGTSLQSTLDELATLISTNPVTGYGLGIIANVLDQVGGALPAPLSTTVDDLGSQLSAKAATMTGTSGTNGTGGTSGTSGTSGTNGTSGTSGTSGTNGSSSGAPDTRFAYGLLKKDTRTGNATTVTLVCYATAGTKCTDTIKVTEKGFHRLTRKVTFAAGRTDRLILKLKPIKTKKPVKKALRRSVKKHATTRPVMRVTVTSGKYRATKTLR